VQHGPDCGSLTGDTWAPALRTAHRVLLEGIEADRPVFVRIESVDTAGNRGMLPPEPDCLEVSIASRCAISADFESPAAGWTHAAVLGIDDWRPVPYDEARSPPTAFHSDNPGQQKDASLVTPPVDIPPGAVLSFWHAFEFESGFDGSLLEITTDGGATWTDLGPAIVEGTYNGTITVAEGDLVVERPCWTGGALGAMVPVRVPMSGFDGPARQFRFRIRCDASVGSGGWYIDDVSLCTFDSGSTAPPFTRGNCNGDGSVNLSDAVFLFNYLFLGGDLPGCTRACDANGSGDLNLTDGIYLLDHLFRGGPPLPPPNGCRAYLDPGPPDCLAPACIAA